MLEEQEPVKVGGVSLSGLYKIVQSKDGSFSFSRMAFYAFGILCIIVTTNWNTITTDLQEFTKAQSFKEMKIQEQLRRESDFVEMMPSLMSSLRDINKAELVIFFKHYPYPERTYIKAMYHNGRFPKGLSADDFQEIMTDSSRGDWITHQKGLPYNSFGNEPKSYLTDMHFYSCAVYNANAEYDGKVSIYWTKKPEPWNTELYYTSCMRASRQIGKYL